MSKYFIALIFLLSFGASAQPVEVFDFGSRPLLCNKTVCKNFSDSTKYKASSPYINPINQNGDDPENCLCKREEHVLRATTDATGDTWLFTVVARHPFSTGSECLSDSGNATSSTRTSIVVMRRWNSNGTLDTGLSATIQGKEFDPQNHASLFNGYIMGIATDSLQRIYIGVRAHPQPGLSRPGFFIFRLTSSGNLDTTWTDTTASGPVAPGIVRIDELDGLDDAANFEIGSSSFLDGEGNMHVVAGNKLVVVARHYLIGANFLGDAYTDISVMRFLPSGALDTTLDNNGYLMLTKSQMGFGVGSYHGSGQSHRLVSSTYDAASDKIVGAFLFDEDNWDGTALRPVVFRMVPSTTSCVGSACLDSSFSGNGAVNVIEAATLSDPGPVIGGIAAHSGRVAVALQETTGSTTGDIWIYRFTSTGVLDTAFDTDGRKEIVSIPSSSIIHFGDLGVGSTVHGSIAMERTGRILIAGVSSPTGEVDGASGFLMWLTASGAPDTQYFGDGIMELAGTYFGDVLWLHTRTTSDLGVSVSTDSMAGQSLIESTASNYEDICINN